MSKILQLTQEYLADPGEDNLTERHEFLRDVLIAGTRNTANLGKGLETLIQVVAINRGLAQALLANKGQDSSTARHDSLCQTLIAGIEGTSALGRHSEANQKIVQNFGL